jgi:hypothetical protein
MIAQMGTTADVESFTDSRTSDQQMHDLKEAYSIRSVAERLDVRGEHVCALLFRDATWCLENGRGWLSDANVPEERR